MVQRPLICQNMKANLVFHVMSPLKDRVQWSARPLAPRAGEPRNCVSESLCRRHLDRDPDNQQLNTLIYSKHTRLQVRTRVTDTHTTRSHSALSSVTPRSARDRRQTRSRGANQPLALASRISTKTRERVKYSRHDECESVCVWSTFMFISDSFTQTHSNTWC